MFSIRQLQPGDEAALEHFLLAHLDSAMFLLSNLRKAGLIDNNERYSGTYIAAFEDEQIVGVVAHYWNGNLLCQAPVHLDALCRQALSSSGRLLAGLVGPGTQVNAICRSFALTPQQYKIAGTEGLFTLPLANLRLPTPLHNGAVVGRRMTVDDIDQLSTWRAAYNHETLGDPDTPESLVQAQTEMTRTLEENVGWVLEAEGQLVAMSAFNATIPEAVQVGGVYTPPTLRGRGYGRAVVAASLRDALAEGAQRAILFTDDDNIAAQRAYRSLGFEKVGDWGLVLLKKPVFIG